MSGGVCNWEWGSVWQGVEECVDGSGGVWQGVFSREWGSMQMVVGECVTGSGEMCGRGSVWMVVGDCVTGSGGVCGKEWGSVWLGVGECEKMKGFQMHLFAFGAPTPVFFFIMCSKVVYILLFLFVGIFVFAHVRM